MTPELEEAIRAWLPVAESRYALLGDAIEPTEAAMIRAAQKAFTEQPAWILRTWADVRRGDTVRLPGTEHTATIADRYVSTGEDRLGRGWHVIAAPKHWDDHIVQPGECWLLFEGESTPRNMDPAKPVELLLTPAEVQAIEVIGWEHRLEVR